MERYPQDSSNGENVEPDRTGSLGAGSASSGDDVKRKGWPEVPDELGHQWEAEFFDEDGDIRLPTLIDYDKLFADPEGQPGGQAQPDGSGEDYPPHPDA